MKITTNWTRYNSKPNTAPEKNSWIVTAYGEDKPETIIDVALTDIHITAMYQNVAGADELLENGDWWAYAAIGDQK